MARLTRTQKYAELREQITHDREESLRTQELDKLEEQLNSFKVSPEPILTRTEETTKPQINTEVKKTQDDTMKSLDDILNSMMASSFSNESPIQEEITETIIENEPVQEEPVQENKVVEEVTPVEETKEEAEFEEAPVVAPVEEKPEEVVQSAPVQDTMEIISDEVDLLQSIIETVKPVEEEKAIEVQPEPVKEEKPVEVKVEPVDVQPTSNEFLDNTFKEVNDYNKQTGKTILDDLSNTLIEEVIHPDAGELKIDDDFTNTVSLEIDKVLSEIQAANEAEAAEAENTIVIDATESIEEKPVEVEAVEEKPVEEPLEHPVLAKAQEEVVEIKNISETVNMAPVNDVVDDTIPFNVEKQVEEDEEDEYEDEEPSKALNIILGILIFVLIAVLGVIVYYILVAEGIIK